MAGMTAKGLSPAYPFRIGNGYVAEACLNMDDEHNHGNCYDHEHKHAEITDGACLDIMIDGTDVLGERRHDAGEDDKGYAVTNSLSRDLLA